MNKDSVQYCLGCLRYNAEKKECNALRELWDPSTGKECWSRTTSRTQMIQELEAMKAYNEHYHEGKTTRYYEIEKQIKSLRSELEEDPEEVQGIGDWEEVYKSEQKRGKPGGGEKNMDGSPFGPNEMRDNRFMHRRRNPKKYSGW